MNAKTYGEILFISHLPKGHSLSGYENAYRRMPESSKTAYDAKARAVILEFVRRVEEEALKISYSDIQGEADADCWHLSAFRKLSTELKEAK